MACITATLLMIYLIAVCKVDVILLIDDSGSITSPPYGRRQHWEELMDFLKDLIRSFAIGKDLTRVAGK